MSAILGLIATAIVTGMALPKAIGMASRSLQSLAKDIGVDTGGVIKGKRPVVAADMATIRSVRQIRAEMPLATSYAAIGDAEEAKRLVLGRLVAAPFLANDTAPLEQGVAALRTASTIAEVERAGAALTDALENAHQEVFASAVTSACENASRKTGFGRIEALRAPLNSGLIRFAATDEHGRTLVTEIQAAKDRDLKIDTEVLGVSDGSCEQILEVYYKALEAEGVKIGAPPNRKGTGGICALDASRVFLQPSAAPGNAGAEAVSGTDDDIDHNTARRKAAARGKKTVPTVS